MLVSSKTSVAGTLLKDDGGNTLTQVNDVLLMHVFDGFTYLAHVVDHLCLRHGVALCCDALKQLTTREAETERDITQLLL